MNNSDSPISPEEQWAAYFDGNLSAGEAAAFESEHPEAAAERAAYARITGAMRRHSPAPQMRNTDFFNESILREIAPKPSAAAAAPAKERGLWSLWRLAFAGAFSLLVASAIWATFVRGGSGFGEKPRAPYFAQVESVTAGDASLDATVLDADGLKLVWIDGLDRLPNDYVLE